MHVFQQSCGACHTIRGTDAGGIFGPDLTHVMTRTRIAANIEPTTRGYLMGWISNPQTIKPGAKMPAIPLSADDLQSVVAYLETLQ
jgi:cytochrome c oxidase subunit 2